MGGVIALFEPSPIDPFSHDALLGGLLLALLLPVAHPLLLVPKLVLWEHTLDLYEAFLSIEGLTNLR